VEWAFLLKGKTQVLGKKNKKKKRGFSEYRYTIAPYISDVQTGDLNLNT
jgi:hypothetical protein